MKARQTRAVAVVADLDVAVLLRHRTGKRITVARRFQRLDHVGSIAEMLVEHGDVGLAAQRRPVGDLEGDVLIVVEHGATQGHLIGLREAGMLARLASAGKQVIGVKFPSS